MEIVQIAVGVLLLTLGRRLFWLFVSAIGFVAGLYLATQLFQGQPEWVLVSIGLLGGLLGVGLAVLLQSVAIAAAGFFAGGYLALNLMNVFDGVSPSLTWVPFVIGGIIGLILLSVAFSWGLIILSSFTGATFIVRAVDLSSLLSTILLVVLVAVGIAIQANLKSRQRKMPSNPTT